MTQMRYLTEWVGRRCLAVVMVFASSLTQMVAAPAKELSPEANLSALMAPIVILNAAINHADAHFPAEVFTPDAIIIDQFSPYRWTGQQGLTAENWYHGLVGLTKEAHAAFIALRGHVVVSETRITRLSSDSAYLVTTLAADYNEEGRRVHVTGYELYTEKKVEGAWRISACAVVLTS
jgi:hypothetical protein